MANGKDLLEQTITIRATNEFKRQLVEFVAEASKGVSTEIKISDLVRLGLDWIMALEPGRTVDILVGDAKVTDYIRKNKEV